jgi:hypothetical protein
MTDPKQVKVWMTAISNDSSSSQSCQRFRLNTRSIRASLTRMPKGACGQFSRRLTLCKASSMSQRVSSNLENCTSIRTPKGNSTLSSKSSNASLRKPGGREQSKSHRGKYRGTIVKLALVLAFCEDSQLPAIPIEALHRAVRLTSFYDRHAKRIYALGEPSDLASAHELLGHLKSGHLKDGFGARDVEMRKWKRLKTLGEIEGAIAVLCDHGHLLERRNKDTGGAPSRKLFINPAVEREVRGRAA